MAKHRSRRPGNPSRPTLITGGAGFIGSNLANRIAAAGGRVRVLDNLSRPGVSANLQWLCRRHGGQIEVIEADIRDGEAVAAAVKGAAGIFHLAAQVAVTTSLRDPQMDFETNLVGARHVLEAARMGGEGQPILFASTNKVYGDLGDQEPRPISTRYAGANGNLSVNEDARLSFHSPYGCSKGAADQYALDYCRSYRLPTVVFRMSCIYGGRQCGTEDQGWVAHFLLRALLGEPITIYGDGRQVRDILFVQDLMDAMLKARNSIERAAGEAFNIGGGL